MDIGDMKDAMASVSKNNFGEFASTEMDGFLSSFAIAITNPAAILSFIVVFSMFRIEGNESIGENVQLVLGIFCGTCFWWLLIAVVVSRIRERVTDGFYLKLNRIFGILMVLFGAGMGVRAFFV